MARHFAAAKAAPCLLHSWFWALVCLKYWKEQSINIWLNFHLHRKKQYEASESLFNKFKKRGKLKTDSRNFKKCSFNHFFVMCKRNKRIYKMKRITNFNLRNIIKSAFGLPVRVSNWLLLKSFYLFDFTH